MSERPRLQVFTSSLVWYIKYERMSAKFVLNMYYEHFKIPDMSERQRNSYF